MNRRDALALMGATLLPTNGRTMLPLPQPSSTWASWDEVCEQLVGMELEANRQHSPGEQLHYTGAITWQPGVAIGYGVGPPELAADDFEGTLAWLADAWRHDPSGVLGSHRTACGHAWAVAVRGTCSDELLAELGRPTLYVGSGREKGD